MFTFLLVVHGLIAAALVGVILVQKSEGGGLGMGSGSPSGLMSARGAADFLTRATTILAALFIAMALLLAAYASLRNSGGQIDTSLAHQGTPGPINAPVTPAPPTSAIPMMGGATAPASNITVPVPEAANGTAPANGAEPAAAPAPRALPPVSHLRTIDTHTGNNTVGINGVGINGVGAGAAPAPAKSNPAKAATPTVTIPAIKAPAPVKIEATPVPATGAAGSGNSTQP